MPLFEIKATRRRYAHFEATVEIEAKTAEDAVQAARDMDENGDLEWEIDGYEDAGEPRYDASELPIEDQYPQHAGDRGTIDPDDQR